MKHGMKIIAFGAIAALAIAGVALVMMNQSGDVNALANKVPVVSISDTAAEDAVLVTAMVDGESVPMSGAQVTICKMNLTSDGNHTTMRVMECVTMQANEDGKVMYQFQAGEKYMVCAQNGNQNQVGYANQNMNETEANACNQNQWEWGNMEGQSFQYMNQKLVKAP